MTYLEKYVLQKGINKVSDYMNGLGYKSCCVCADENKITYHNNPMRNDITIIFSEKGRAKQVIYENYHIKLLFERTEKLCLCII